MLLFVPFSGIPPQIIYTLRRTKSGRVVSLSPIQTLHLNPSPSYMWPAQCFSFTLGIYMHPYKSTLNHFTSPTFDWLQKFNLYYLYHNEEESSSCCVTNHNKFPSDHQNKSLCPSTTASEIETSLSLDYNCEVSHTHLHSDPDTLDTTSTSPQVQPPTRSASYFEFEFRLCITIGHIIPDHSVHIYEPGLKGACLLSGHSMHLKQRQTGINIKLADATFHSRVD